MSFLRKIFDPANPTREWGSATAARLVLDLRSGALNGVRPGDPLEMARFLGEGEAAHETLVEYEAAGIALEHKDGRVDTIDVVLAEFGDNYELSAFGGDIQLRNGGVTAETPFTEAFLLEALGEPYDRSEGCGLTLSYRIDGIDIDFEFEEHDRAEFVSIYVEESD